MSNIKRFKDFINENDNLGKSVKGASKFGIDTGHRNWIAIGYTWDGGPADIEIFPFVTKDKAEEFIKDLFEESNLLAIDGIKDNYYREFDGKTLDYTIGIVGDGASYYSGSTTELQQSNSNKFQSKLYYTEHNTNDYTDIYFFTTEEKREKYLQSESNKDIEKGELDFKF